MSRGKKLAALIAGGAIAAVGLSACGSGEEASADSDVTLKIAAQFGPENWQTQSLQAYADAVEEESDGAVQFEFYYGDALVSPAEVPSSLESGTIDIAWTLLSYEPAEFPISTWISEAAFHHDASPDVGALQATATSLEWGFSNEAYLEELEAAGLQPLLPRMASHDSFGLMCSDGSSSLNDIQGKRARVGGKAWSNEARNLGMVPVDLPTSETFTSFQQGLLDCFIGGATDVDSLGLTELGGEFTSAGLTGYDSAGLMMSKDTWESLSENQKDALWNQLPTLIDTWFSNYRKANFEFVENADQQGVAISAPGPEMAERVHTYHRELSKRLGSEAPASIEDGNAAIEQYKDISDKWLKELTELGYSTEDATWAEMAARTNGKPGDIDAFVETLTTDVLDEHRPE